MILSVRVWKRLLEPEIYWMPWSCWVGTCLKLFPCCTRDLMMSDSFILYINLIQLYPNAKLNKGPTSNLVVN